MGFVSDVVDTVGDVVGGVVDVGKNILTGGAYEASDAATEAASISAASQTEALNYLKEINALPQQYKESALNALAGVYGLEGGTGSQADLIQSAIESPLYTSLMGGLEAGEESILRNAAATGGLRSGNASYNLADYATQLQNSSLLEAYNQQLSGLNSLAGLSTNESSIADLISSIGSTLASGVANSGSATASGYGNTINNLLGLGSLGLEAYSAGLFCDRRLKKNIKVLGKIKGFNWCSFDWNPVAEKLGLRGSSCGIMADEVFDKVPEAVILKDGFMFVLYDMLGFMGGAKCQVSR
jgi:hypothetical protein